MNHIISIDDKTKTGRTVLELIKTITKTEKGISFLDNELKDTISIQEFSNKLKQDVLKKMKAKK